MNDLFLHIIFFVYVEPPYILFLYAIALWIYVTIGMKMLLQLLFNANFKGIAHPKIIYSFQSWMTYFLQ